MATKIGNLQSWRRGWDSNPRWALTHSGFRDRCTNPLCDLSGSLLFRSSAPEKLLHQRPAFFFQNACSDFDPVIQKICVADAKATYNCSRAFVRRSINQTPDPRLYQSPCAHRARFDRRIYIHASQPVVAQLPGGFAKGNDFSVGRWIAVSARAVAGNSEEFVFANDTSPYGHFAACFSLSSSIQRLPHPLLIQLCFSGGHTTAIYTLQTTNGHYRVLVETVSSKCELPISDCPIAILNAVEPHKLAIGN